MKIEINPLRLFAFALVVSALPLDGAVMVTPTTDTTALANALNAQGLTITAVTVEHGIDGQFATYTNYSLSPVTIANGVVLSSGEVSHVGDPPDPELEFPEPNWWMNGNTSPEFEAYGPGHIESFEGAFDVAGLRVDFTLATNSQVKFDFIFGSVEYPTYTSDYTDALLVFLDGIDPTNQITADANGLPVQVGVYFSGLVATNDLNTAFASPHGLVGRMTTTTAQLPAGNHTIRFEVGDVNDDVLDSAAFIANLRAEAGKEGTDFSDVPPPLRVTGSQLQQGTNYLGLTWTNNGVNVVLESTPYPTGTWSTVSAPWITNLNWISTIATNKADMQLFRLRRQ